MEVVIKETPEDMAKLAAELIAEVVRKKPRAVLGLATGSTPLGTYKELIRLHKQEGLDFSRVVTFNLDEYVGLAHEHPQSYHYFMWENLFKHINVNAKNVHIPDGTAKDIPAFCHWYEEQIVKAGGLDVQLLGIGSNGHIAFNEPGSSLGSRTRVKTLDEKTRQDNTRFFRNMNEVPKYAITMGIGTIMDARQLVLLANGAGKADAIQKTCEGAITAMVPATIVQLHPKATIIVDKQASTKLTREYPAEPNVLVLA